MAAAWKVRLAWDLMTIINESLKTEREFALDYVKFCMQTDHKHADSFLMY